MKSRFLPVLGMLIIMILSACTAKSADPLNDTGWILTELNGQPVLAGPLVTLNFASGNLAGTDGCNHYSGTYTMEDSQITVGKEILSTLMACEESIMQQASEYIQVLQASFNYKIQGNQLSLLDDSQVVRAVFTLQSQDLAGTSWTVTGFNNGKQAVVSPLLDTGLTVNFDQEGKVSGSAGCNQYFASYQTKGQSITISQAGMTEMYCNNPQGIMDQESQFLAALQTAATYRVDGNSLEFRTAGDEIALTLLKAP